MSSTCIGLFLNVLLYPSSIAGYNSADDDCYELTTNIGGSFMYISFEKIIILALFYFSKYP